VFVRSDEDFFHFVEYAGSASGIIVCVFKQLLVPSPLAGAPLIVLFIVSLIYFLFFKRTFVVGLIVIQNLLSCIFLFFIPFLRWHKQYRETKAERQKEIDKYYKEYDERMEAMAGSVFTIAGIIGECIIVSTYSSNKRQGNQKDQKGGGVDITSAPHGGSFTTLG
jgi:hypothetical protein